MPRLKSATGRMQHDEAATAPRRPPAATQELRRPSACGSDHAVRSSPCATMIAPSLRGLVSLRPVGTTGTRGFRTYVVHTFGSADYPWPTRQPVWLSFGDREVLREHRAAAAPDALTRRTPSLHDRRSAPPALQSARPRTWVQYRGTSKPAQSGTATCRERESRSV